MLEASFLRAKFEAGQSYQEHVATGTPAQQENWRAVYERAQLGLPQRDLIGAFVREMNVLVLSGVWCGDCAQQCPLLQRIAEANPQRVRVRFLDRDTHLDLAERVRICGGLRVPTVIFAAEDFEFVGLYGDRTLTRYRAVAARQLGPSCPLPGASVPDDELAGTLQDWIDEFERVHLLLRTSGRLRQKYGD